MKYRLYGLVPYNLSPIQQGIQFSHGLMEYALLTKDFDKPFNFLDWAENDKTVIILNGGTTNTNIDKLGTLNQHVMSLEMMGIKYATFKEPDLGDQLTAVVFLVPETVYDEELYPEPKLCSRDWLTIASEEEVIVYDRDKEIFLKEVGEDGLKLRQFLKQFKLA